MGKNRFWQGVRMREAAASPDPDAPPRLVTLPVAWDDAAAVALAALDPGTGPASLERAADRWIGPIAAGAARQSIDLSLGDMLRRLLLSRRGAPTPAVWRGEAGAVPGFVLNAAAFLADGGFDAGGFGEAAEAATLALTLAAPEAPRLAIGFADLAGLLAGLGLDFDSDAARDVARCLAAILRGRSEAASARLVALAPAGAVAPATWSA